MTTRINLGNITVEVAFKAIKNVHLSVYPPTGTVRISAPERMSLDTIRVFAISKLGWIKQQRKKLQAQERETPREYLERESHYVWGRRYLLKVIELEQAPAVSLQPGHLVLTMRRESNEPAKDAVVAQWYREQLKRVAWGLISKWQPIIGVKVTRLFVQQMKTKWGSCNPEARTMRLNTELTKKPEECLEYIVVHELVHLLEPSHNARFIALMDQFLPKWRYYRQRLNRLPIRHADWSY
jgi:hypothetical protein